MGIAEGWMFIYYVMAYPVMVMAGAISAFAVAVLVAAALKQAFS